MKLTEWFSIATRGQPAIPGWYEIQYAPEDEDGDRFFWDGETWRWHETGAATSFGNVLVLPEERWRGLAEKP